MTQTHIDLSFIQIKGDSNFHSMSFPPSQIYNMLLINNSLKFMRRLEFPHLSAPYQTKLLLKFLFRFV